MGFTLGISPLPVGARRPVCRLRLFTRVNISTLRNKFWKGSITMKLTEIVDNGNTLETLKYLRHKIAEAIDDSTSGRDIAALSRQLQIVIESISELEKITPDTEIETVLEQVRKRHPPVRSEKKYV